MEDLRYPIGKFRIPDETQPGDLDQWVAGIAGAPEALRAAVSGLTPKQLDTPYREGGWTVRQVIHHVADSHMNAYIRFRLALTEDAPTIKTYKEALWAELHDAKSAPVEVSLGLIDALHARWTELMRSMQESDWDRTFHHPDLGPMKLKRNAALYSWHGRHHVAHITGLRQRSGWV
jgi:hypothetical protein